MIEELNQIDINDYNFIRIRFGIPTRWAAGLKKENEIKPCVTSVLFDDNRVVSVFHSKPIYYETKEGNWRPLSEICTYHGNRLIYLKPEAVQKMSPRFMLWLQKRQRILGNELVIDYGYMGAGVQPHHLVYATTSTFYPDPNTETTCVDGDVFKEDNSNWATTRNATTGASASDSNVLISVGSAKETNYRLRRGFVLFDTSSIPDSDTISSATLDIMDSSSGGTGPNSESSPIYLVSATPATNTAIITDDFDQIGATDYGNMTDSGVQDAYQTLTLNASGISAISKTGITKYALRANYDFNNTTPVAGLEAWQLRSADNSGTTQDPKLVVIHGSASGPANLKSYNTNLKANIKSINTNLIANVKSLNTNV